MSGVVTGQSGTWLLGWAGIREDRSYAPVVHLMCEDSILASTIADGTRDDVAGSPEAAQGHWFGFDLSEHPELDADKCRIVVGETGETFGSTLDGDVLAAFTYRDALAIGMSAEDIVNGFYLDFLRRPADEPALAHFHLKAKGELAASIERWRKSLLDSDEYRMRPRRAKDAIGRIFSTTILPRTSRRVRDFESCAPAFLTSSAPIEERLIGFFPGLLLRDDAMEQVERFAASDLPCREIFYRALALLADRPALVLPHGVIERRPAIKAMEGTDEIIVSCRSAHFGDGWHKVETDEGQEHRWMDQIGIVDFCPEGQILRRIEIVIDGAYGDVGRLLAATERQVLRTELSTREGCTRLVITADGDEPFTLSRLVLLAEHARCPWRHEGQPDPRLLSIRARDARLWVEVAA